MRRLGGLGAVVGAVVLTFAGGAAVKWYVWDVVVRAAGEPDRSMLFWGLPILFVGLGAIAAAVGLAFIAREGFR